jgi:hypothetical protein
MEFVLSENQFNLVYNSFSFVIASMGAAFIFFLLVRSKVAPRHRMAVTLSTLVVAIALYHYVRIFESFSSAFDFVGGEYVQTGAPFNEGYRYVDWLLTVPLLLAELVVVLKLAKSTTRSLLIRLTIAAIAMIALGWPGELADPDSTARTLWGIASTIPFLYILYVLFVELGRSLDRQSPQVRKLVDGLRYIILATWGIYPLGLHRPECDRRRGHRRGRAPGRLLDRRRARQAAVRSAGARHRTGQVPSRRLRAGHGRGPRAADPRRRERTRDELITSDRPGVEFPSSAPGRGSSGKETP